MLAEKNPNKKAKREYHRDKKKYNRADGKKALRNCF